MHRLLDVHEVLEKRKSESEVNSTIGYSCRHHRLIIVILGGLDRPRRRSQTNASLVYGELRLLVRPGWGSRTRAHVVREGFGRFTNERVS